MVLFVLRRIQWGIGLFCFWAFASFCLVRKDLWLYIRRKKYSSAIFSFKRFSQENDALPVATHHIPLPSRRMQHPFAPAAMARESMTGIKIRAFEGGTAHTGILTDSA